MAFINDYLVQATIMLETNKCFGYELKSSGSRRHLDKFLWMAAAWEMSRCWGQPAPRMTRARKRRACSSGIQTNIPTMRLSNKQHSKVHVGNPLQLSAPGSHWPGIRRNLIRCYRWDWSFSFCGCLPLSKPFLAGFKNISTAPLVYGLLCI